jgi:hypothetical protein
VVTDVPHESQEGCIAALHEEIGRVRDILATVRPAGVPAGDADDDRPASVRVALSDSDLA